MAVLRGFVAHDIVAIFDQAPGGGDLRDITAACNAPALDPASHLDKVYFHSAFDYYQVAALNLGVTINHASVAGVAGNAAAPPDFIFLGNVTISKAGQVVAADHLLLTHNLGYVPRFFVTYNGQMIPHGFPVQMDDAFRVRVVCAYATTTEIRLREIGYSTASALSAASRTYGVMVFAAPAPNPSLPLFSGGPGAVQVGRGMIDSANRYLRVTGPGDTPFGIQLAPAVDYNNGGVRFADPDGNLYTLNTYASGFSAPAAIAVGL